MNNAPSKVVVQRRYEAQAQPCMEALKRLLATENASELLCERAASQQAARGDSLIKKKAVCLSHIGEDLKLKNEKRRPA